MEAREAALLTLYDVYCNGAYSNLALKEMMRKCKGMKPEDRRLLTTLVYGVISRGYTIDHIIGRYSSVKVRKLAKYIRIIMEIAVYQLMFMDKIPQSAAVNESVKLAKRYGRRGSDRFVNGVLRSFCRNGMKYDLPDDDISGLAVMYSFPESLVKLFTDDYGAERAASLMESLNKAPQLVLRPNRLKVSCDELKGMLEKNGISVLSEKDGQLYTAGFDVGGSELYEKGFFSVQDRGAYMAGIALEPKEGETVIDMCAAPGGKSTHIAELQNDSGIVISCDIYEHKLKLIEGSAKRLGIRSIETRLCDGTKTDSGYIGKADRVLCDVPCSGLGIVRRKPDIKLCRSDISLLPDIQRAILENGARYLKPGGVLVYSTCTLLKRENEGITSAFLGEHSNFERVYEKTYYPDADDSDGFYICKMIKK